RYASKCTSCALVPRCTLKSVNVGLVTASPTPSPWARPWTKVVLPAPRSPCSASTASGERAFANSAASARICSAVSVATLARSLSQMLVAMVVLEPDTTGLERAARGALERAQTGQPEWKLAPPRRLESFAVRLSVHDEQQFIVLAIAQRVVDRRPAGAARQRARGPADRHLCGLNDRTRSTWCEGLDVLGESVAHVHERSHLRPFRQPGRFLEARTKTPVVTQDAPTEGAGDIQPIADAPARASQCLRSDRFAPQRQRCNEATRVAGDVAADDGHVILPRNLCEPPVESFEPGHADV